MSQTTIPTKRLFLRPFDDTDGPAYSEALPYSFAITLRTNGQLIGHCRLGPERDSPNHAGIAFTLNQDYWGQGYATEAVRALLRYGFEQQNMQYLFAECQSENLAAKRVLEKVGMQPTEPITRDSTNAASLRFGLQSPD